MYNKAFKKDYDKLFQEDPLQANLFLLLVDLADDKGQIYFAGSEDQMHDQLIALADGRFNDINAYQL